MRHHKKYVHVALCASILLLLGFAGWRSVASGPASRVEAAPKAIVYRSPTCGCCGNYVSYLKRNGFEVETRFMETAERSELGVPAELGSCHTTVIDGYTIEGHVPVEAIRKLLTEKPPVKGIGMPGMPSGSPGMPGPKREAFRISGFTEDGSVSDFVSL